MSVITEQPTDFHCHTSEPSFSPPLSQPETKSNSETPFKRSSSHPEIGNNSEPSLSVSSSQPETESNTETPFRPSSTQSEIGNNSESLSLSSSQKEAESNTETPLLSLSPSQKEAENNTETLLLSLSSNLIDAENNTETLLLSLSSSQKDAENNTETPLLSSQSEIGNKIEPLLNLSSRQPEKGINTEPLLNLSSGQPKIENNNNIALIYNSSSGEVDEKSLSPASQKNTNDRYENKSSVHSYSLLSTTKAGPNNKDEYKSSYNLNSFSYHHGVSSSAQKVGNDCNLVVQKDELISSLWEVKSEETTCHENSESVIKLTTANSCNIRTQGDTVVSCKDEFPVKGTNSITEEALKPDVSCFEASSLTALISSQRDKILRIRREKRPVDKKNFEKQDLERKCFEVGGNAHVQKRSAESVESKSVSEDRAKKHKRLKKQHLERQGFTDIFGEPLCVNRSCSEAPVKRERKIPSKFLYYLEMDKSRNDSHNTDKKKHYKTNHQDCDNFYKYKQDRFKTPKMKSKMEIKIEKKESNRSMKEEAKVSEVKERGTKGVYQLSSNKNALHEGSSSTKISPQLPSPETPSSPKSLKASQILRDNYTHHNCMGRYYRLKTQHWNCSSRHALQMLKRKYYSLRLLFKRKPVVCLERLKPQDIEIKYEKCFKECKSKIYRKQVFERDTVNTKEAETSSSDTPVRRKDIKSESVDLVDPRVMSLSRTLQSGNNGKIGYEKTFKSHSGKQIKTKNRSKSLSHMQSEKLKKNKPDWSKWREKLKEASMRMVEKKKDVPVSHKTIKRFPGVNDNPTPCANSILHLRIPLKSNRSTKRDEEESFSSPLKEKENIFKSNESVRHLNKIDSAEANKSVEVKEETEVLKEINEELTIEEEYETESVVGYSINGYSIEIVREPSVDDGMGMEESPVNECFDEEEMNKILYGDDFKEESMKSLNIDERCFPDTDANLTVTSDIIPNLCVQKDIPFRESEFSDEVDLSPPVLEKLSSSSRNQVNDSLSEENFESDETQDYETFSVEKKNKLTGNENFKGQNKKNLEANNSRESLKPSEDKKCPVEVGFHDIDSYKFDQTEHENGSGDCVFPVIKDVRSLSGTQEIEMYSESSADDLNANDGQITPERNLDNEADNQAAIESELSESVSGSSVGEEKSNVENSKTVRLNLFEGFAETLVQDNGLQTQTISAVKDSDNMTTCSLVHSAQEIDSDAVTKFKCNVKNLKFTDLNKKKRTENVKEQNCGCKENHLERCRSVLDNNALRSKSEVGNVEAINKGSDELRKENDLKSLSKLDEDIMCSDTSRNDKNDAGGILVSQNEKDTYNKIGRLEPVTNEKHLECDKEKIRSGKVEALHDATQAGAKPEDIFRKETCEHSEKLDVARSHKEIYDSVGQVRDDSVEINNQLRKNKKVKAAADIHSDITKFDVERPKLKFASKRCEEIEKRNFKDNKICSDVPSDATGHAAEKSSEKVMEKKLEQIENSKTDTGIQKKRKHASGESLVPEKLPAPCREHSDQKMELNEERLMRDFPKHNWLFNKYNISECAVDSNNIKDVSSKSKKPKKDDTDVTRKAMNSKDAKIRRKSCNTTSNVLENQRKQSRQKISISLENSVVQNGNRTVRSPTSSDHNIVTVTSNKFDKHNSDTDKGSTDEKRMLTILKDDQSDFERKKLSPVYQGIQCVSILSDAEGKEVTEKPCDHNNLNVNEDIKDMSVSFCNVTAIDLSFKTKDDHISVDKNLCVTMPGSHLEMANDSLFLERMQKFNLQSDGLNSTSGKTVSVSETRETDVNIKIAENKTSKTAENMQETLLGNISDVGDDKGDNNDDEDDDDEKKLEIDENACLDGVSDSLDISPQHNSQLPVTGYQIPQSEQATKESAIGRVANTCQKVEEEKSKQSNINLCDTKLPELASAPLSAHTSDTQQSSGEVSVSEISDQKSEETPCEQRNSSPTESSTVSRPKPICDIGTVKPDAASISFRQRTKAPVQLVHPQVYKPPEKVKVESVVTSEIQNHGSNSSLEKEEESVSITVKKCIHGERTTVEYGESKTSSDVNAANSSTVCLPSTLPRNIDIPKTVFSTQTKALAVTTASNYASGMVIPIQPFVQDVSCSRSQRYLCSESQLQQNIAQVQSLSGDTICQQTSPVPIQNQIIPVTIYQTENQTVISNYTLTNQNNVGLVVSSQSTNAIPAQPVSLNRNQVQVTGDAVRAPLCPQVKAGPPPLFILPKTSEMPEFKKGNHLAGLRTQGTRNSSQGLSESHVNLPLKTVSSVSPAPAQLEPFTRCNESNPPDKFCSGNTASCYQGKADEHVANRSKENVENFDAEIEKQMEELDREIKRKEQEQEQMKRKKLELLEKMKLAKNVNISKDSTLQGCSNSALENVRSVKRVISDSVTDQSEIPDTSSSSNCYKELDKKNSMSEVKSTVCERIKLTGERHSSSEDLLSLQNRDVNHNDFNSDTPIDLSATIKPSKSVSFERNLLVTQTDSVSSLNENGNTLESDAPDSCGVDDSLSQIETESNKNDSDDNTVDDEGSQHRDQYSNKSDGINYIEDIGLVNPFTGEYEINEDVEGVEYLDLSSKLDYTKSIDEEKEGSNKEGVNDTENDVLNVKNGFQNLDCKMDSDTSQQESDMHRNVCLGKSLSESYVTNSETNVSVNQSDSSVERGFQTHSSSSFTSCVSTGSSLSSISTTTFAAAQELVVKTSVCTQAAKSLVDSTAIKTLQVSDETSDREESTAAVDGIINNVQNRNEANEDEEPLNLETIRNPSWEKDSALKDSKTERKQCNTETCPQPLCNLPNQNVLQPKSVEQTNNKNINNSVPNSSPQTCSSLPSRETKLVGGSSQVSSCGPVSAPDIQSASQKIDESLSLQKEQHLQDQKVEDTVNTSSRQSESVNTSSRQSESTNSYKQNCRTRAVGRISRGMFLGRMRERLVELKPAHSKSPPKKIQKGAKPLPAHNQKATSRETMKLMSKTPSVMPENTSPYICRKHPVFLSPKEGVEPLPRLWEKKPPKPAHSKRPFGIAGHLIIPSSRKYKKRKLSEEHVTLSRFNSLPNTPTSVGPTPPRPSSVDEHGYRSPIPSSDTHRPVCSPSEVVQKVCLPSPIRAHCRPKSFVSKDQFSETNVLRPPAFLRNARSHSTSDETTEIIDLTNENVPAPVLSSEKRPVESPRSTEIAIQKELSNAMSKRQRLDVDETGPVEKNDNTSRSTTVRSKQIMNQVAMMPPPPYVGRQRMPVLLQVPRDRAVFEQSQRMPYDRRMECSQTMHENTMTNKGMHRQQIQQNVVQETPRRPQTWASQYSGPSNEARPYGQVHVQDFSVRNESYGANQEMTLQHSQQMMYLPRGTTQTLGNPRMQLAAGSVPLHNISQQGYSVRGQNQTQIHQLLQQPRVSAPQHRGETGPRMMQIRETSPHMMQFGEQNPRMMQMKEVSPQMIQRRETSPRTIQMREASHQMVQRRDANPQMTMNGNVSPQMMNRRLNVQMSHNANALTVHPANNPTVQDGEMNQNSMYLQSNGRTILQTGDISPQQSPVGMVAANQRGHMIQDCGSSHNSQIPSNNYSQGSSGTVQRHLTPEQRFQRMQQIRAQYIQSRQLQNRDQIAETEPRIRMPDVRNQHFGNSHTNEVACQQHMTGYNAGMPSPSSGNKGQPVPSSTFPQAVAGLENQTHRNIQPKPYQVQGVNGPAPYLTSPTQRQTVVLTSAPQQVHFHQNFAQNNIQGANSVHHNVFNRPRLILPKQNNMYSATTGGGPDQCYSQAQIQAARVAASGQAQGNGFRNSLGPSNVSMVSGGQFVQFQTNNMHESAHTINDKRLPFQNQNPHLQTENTHQLAPNNYSKTVDLTETCAISSENNQQPCQQSMNSTQGLAVDSNRVNSQAVVMPSNPEIVQYASEETKRSVQQSATVETQQHPSPVQDQTKGSQINTNQGADELPHLQQVHGECVMCGKYSLYLCSNCKKIWYCSPECQLKHWQTHAAECEGQTG